jgi:thymidylate synthase (FAD)
MIEGVYMGSLGSIDLLKVYGSDLDVVRAAKVSYGNDADELDDKGTTLISFLAKNKHYSPFRHCFMQFRIDMPMFIKFQWWKHIIGSNWGLGDESNIGWNEISGRYTSKHVSIDSFYIPSHYRKQSKENKQVSEESQELDHCDIMLEVQKQCKEALSLYNDLIAEGVAKEQARIVLPLNFRTQVIWTASLQAVAHFIKLRTDKTAQYEIQLFAKKIAALAEYAFPVSMKALIENF